MPEPPTEPPSSGGIHVGNVDGNLEMKAGGDIVGGDKVEGDKVEGDKITYISAEVVTQYSLVTASPYRGLDRFEQENKDLFFGRDQLIKRLLAQVSTSNILLVLGASGSGKSSVVRAGLLPRLKAPPGTRYRCFTLVPDINPFESLRSSLQRDFNQRQTGALADAQSGTPSRLIHTLQGEGEQWFIFIDQFEEIFTLSEEPLRKSFIAALLEIAEDSSSSTKLVLAMRADFFDRFGPFPEFAKLIDKNIASVADMYPDELRLAIERPAAQHGVVFEEKLVEEIIKDVQDQVGSLPLLQYTLDLLWKKEYDNDRLVGRHLKTQTYRELGGVRGALQKRADEIYADLKPASEKQEIVRQIFLRLVDIAGKEATKEGWRPVRRRVPMADFRTAQEQELLRALIDQKLLVSDREGTDATVEVVHEALFTSWETLKKWIDVGKQIIFVKNRLADDARVWHSRRQKGEIGAKEDLLSGSRLDQALELRKRGEFDTIVGGLPEMETQFLDASAALRDRRRQEEQERQQRELAQAQALATEQKKRADDQEKAAAQQRKLTQDALAAKKKTSEVASRSDFLEATRRLAVNETGAAIAHLARALRVDPENGVAQRRLISLLSQRDWQLPALDLLVQSDFVRFAEISPDGKRIVTICGAEIVQLWDAERGERIGETLRCPGATATFSRDGGKIAVTWGGRWQVLDGATGNPLADAAQRPGSIVAAAFTRDNRQLLVGLELANGAGEVLASDGVGGPLQKLVSWPNAAPEAFDTAGARVIALEREPNTSAEEKPKIARVWSLRTGKPATIPFKHDEEIESAIFSPDGDHIATRTRSRAFVWDLAADRLAFSTEPDFDNLLKRIAYSPDAKLLVAVNVEHPSREMDWMAQVHDAKTGEAISGGRICDHGLFRSAEFSPDSQFLLLCSSGQRARVWRACPHGELEAQEAVAPLEHADVVTVAKMTPDGRRIVTGSFDKTLGVWEATPGLGRALPDTLASAQPVYLAEMSPRGKRIATVSAEPAGLQVWDAATRQPLSQFLPLPEETYGAYFSGDERRLIAGGKDGVARVWDTSSGRLVTQLAHPSCKAIEAAALNFDGTRAATANSSVTLLWDVATNRCTPLAVAPTHQSTPGVEFTPDGARLLTIGGGEMNLWNVATGERVWGPIVHWGRSAEARFSPDGRRFAVFGADIAVELFDSATGKPEHSLQHRGIAADAVFSTDGRLVATCSHVQFTSGYAQVWDAATGSAITQPLAGKDELNQVGLSPDGTLVCATEKHSGCARVWSIATGRECVDPIPHEISLFPAWFSIDGKRLLTVSGRTVQLHELWDLGGPAPSWLADLSEAVGGLALNDSGVAVAVHHRREAFEKVREKITEGSGDDPRLKWARWFFADRRTRTISPFSQRTMREQLGHKP